MKVLVKQNTEVELYILVDHLELQEDRRNLLVYVKSKAGKIKKVTFGDPNMRIRASSKSRRKSFRARHKCNQKKDRTTAGYWSCRNW